MDERLVRQVQEGDQEAFRSLVLSEHARLLRVAQGVLRDIRRLRDASKFEGWSYRLLVYDCIV